LSWLPEIGSITIAAKSDALRVLPQMQNAADPDRRPAAAAVGRLNEVRGVEGGAGEAAPFRHFWRASRHENRASQNVSEPGTAQNSAVPERRFTMLTPRTMLGALLAVLSQQVSNRAAAGRIDGFTLVFAPYAGTRTGMSNAVQH